uniref:Uncharacterized protein n=1 Tax=Syphacia muris TaxID=451379 RepID=A0A0N5AGM3_9BILA
MIKRFNNDIIEQIVRKIRPHFPTFSARRCRKRQRQTSVIFASNRIRFGCRSGSIAAETCVSSMDLVRVDMGLLLRHMRL